MLYLWIFGDNVEDTLGHGRFLFLYLALGSGGRRRPDAGATRRRGVPMVGASGAVVRRARRLPAPVPARHHPHAGDVRLLHRSSSTSRPLIVLGFWIVIQFLNGSTSPSALGPRRKRRCGVVRPHRRVPGRACCCCFCSGPGKVVAYNQRHGVAGAARSAAGRQGARREPREGGPAHPGRRGPGGRPARRQGRLADPHRRRPRPAGPLALREPRRREARPRAASTSGSWSRAACASTSAPPPAASPTACCSAAATRVFAVDVGTAQLDAKLRKDPRVVVMEQTNARALDPRVFDEQPSLAVIDVSFISLEKVLPAVFGVLAPRERDRGAGEAAVRGRPRARGQGRASSASPPSIGPSCSGWPATRCCAAGTSSA